MDGINLPQVIGPDDDPADLSISENAMNALLAFVQNQEDAYRKQLRMDRKKAEEEEKQRTNKRKREEYKDRLEKLMEKKASVRANLKPEPAPDQVDSIRILLRFPNGQRVERGFVIGDSLNDLHDFVLSHPDSPEFFHLAIVCPWRLLPFPHEHEEANENKKQKTDDDENVDDKKEVEGDEHETGTDGGGDVIESDPMSSESPTFASFGILKNEVIYVSDLEQ